MAKTLFMDSQSIKTKGVIVIGATSGIGRGVAALYVSMGYNVGITGRRADLLHEIKESNPNQYFTKVLDVTHTQEIDRILDELAEEIGGCSIVVICSGTGRRNPDLNFEWEKLTLETNVLGFAATAIWAYKYLSLHGGVLAAITSISGLKGFALSPSYCSSKSFQIRYLDSLRQKAYQDNNRLTVTEIRAGFVDTAMGNGDGAFWQASVSKASKQIVQSIGKRRDLTFVSRRWIVISYLLKLIPEPLFRRIGI